MRTLPVSNEFVRFNNAFKADEETAKTSVTEVIEANKKEAKPNKTGQIVTSTLALAALVGSGIAIAKGRKAGKDEAINTLKDEMTKAIKELESKIEKMADSAEKESLKEELQKISDKADNNHNWSVGYLNSLDAKIKALGERTNFQPAQERGMANIDGLILAQHLDNEGKRIPLSNEMIKYLNEVSPNYIHGENVTKPVLKRDATIWSLTAETIPEKEGGLGEVPVQVAKNFESLKLKNVLVRSLPEISGKSSLVGEEGGKIFKYTYGDKELELTKFVEYKVPVYRNGVLKDEIVDAYYCVDPVSGSHRIMLGNSTYFKSEGLYSASEKSTETERYAFLSDAAYELAKILADRNVGGYSIKSNTIFNKLQAPDAAILNDWHAASFAGLMRMKAPLEASEKSLSQEAADKFSKMTLLLVDHNVDYQGRAGVKDGINYASDIINTLFGKYAYDVYTHANTGFVGMGGIEKVLTVEGGVNLANIGTSVATKVKPVSRTYAEEMAQQFDRSTQMQHIFAERLDAGTMVGASNGWDRVVNEVSAKNIKGFNNAINKEKPQIVKNELLKILDGLSDKDKNRVVEVMKTYDALLKGNYKVHSISDLPSMLVNLKDLNIAKVDELLEKLDKKGITKLRTFYEINYTDDIDTIMKARKHNKRLLIEHLQSMIAYDKARPEGTRPLFNITSLKNTDLSGIDIEKLDDTVVLNMGARFVGQKGIDIAVGTIKNIMRDWGKKYPGKPKPVIVIGGADAEGGKYRDMVKSLKKQLGKEGKQVVHMDGYVPNNILQAGSDYTWFPSHFEPDGSKWESLYKGTPVLCTRVGGHVDSVIDGVNGYLTKSTVPEIKASGKDYLKTMIDEFTEINDKAIKRYYDNGGKSYKQFVLDSIKGDQSWIQRDPETGLILRKSPIVGYIEDLGYDLKDFPEIEQIAEKVA